MISLPTQLHVEYHLTPLLIKAFVHNQNTNERAPDMPPLLFQCLLLYKNAPLHLPIFGIAYLQHLESVELNRATR